MYLTRVEIHGFKSFPSRTSITFDAGITAIIGPNGSGKSNVADAIRWVLGEQSPRAMRLRRLEDALFAGGPKRAPAGFAEVSIWMDNTAGWLPIEFNEVVVTRRLHRSGDTEYLLNRRRVRLRDITELFLKARVGQNSYAIMGQGLVDQVLSLRPEERRALIEEAADIRRFRLRMEESHQRLAATRENLDTVELLIAEIAPRLAQLERQSRRAREHADLAGRLAEALRRWYQHQWGEQHRALHSALQLQTERRAAVSAAQSAIAALDQRVDQLRGRLADGQQAEVAAAARLRLLTDDLHEREQKLRLEQDRLGFVQRRLDELAAEVAVLHAEREEVSGADDAAAPADFAARIDAASRRLLAEQRAAAEIDAALQAGRRRVHDTDAPARRARAELRELDERLAAGERGLEAARREQATAGDRRRELLHRLKQYGQAYLARRQVARDCSAAAETAEQSRAAALDELGVSDEQLAEDRRALAEQRGLTEELRRRREMLLRLRARASADGDGPGTAVRAAAAAAGVAVVAALVDVIRAPQGLERAIAAVLEAAPPAFIIAAEEDSSALAEVLTAGQAGRAALSPVAGRSATLPEPSDGIAGVIGIAARLVECGERERPAVDRLLDRVLVVEHLAAARAAADAGWTAVTRDGILRLSSGVLIAGTAGDAAGRFALERELAELPAQLAPAEAEAAQRQAAVDGHARRLDDLRRRRRDAIAAAETAHRAAVRAREALASQRAALAQIGGDLRYLRRSVAGAATRIAEAEAQRAQLSERRSAVARTAATAEAAAEAARRAVRQVDERREQANRAVADARAALATREREQQESAARIERRRLALARLEERLNARVAEIAARRLETARVEAACAGARQTIAALASGREQAERELSPLRQATSDLAATLTAAELEVNNRRRAFTDIERARLAAEAEHDRRALALEQLQEAAAQDGSQLPVAEGEAGGSGDAGGDGGALQEQVRSLRARIRAVGAVNADAEVEYQEAKGRHEFLTVQVADLRSAEVGLLTALTELRGLIDSRFHESFARVAADFEQFFQRFFGGGTAQLVLTDGDSEAAGVDIIARPPGKRLQSLSLLSGGERSLTAVALLFALLQSNPAPFCVLDEVDAALDEANVGRFSQALKELAERTQFIIITHNRATMEAADTIYGVSMGGDAASSLLSLRLEALPDGQ